MFEHLEKRTAIHNSVTGETLWVDLDDPTTWPDDVPRPSAERTTTEQADGDKPSRLITRAEIAALPPLEPLVDGFLYADVLARLVGNPGSYKSFVALDWACCIATGRPWHGRAVKRGPVVYFVGEGSRGIDARVAAWEAHYNEGRPVEGLHFFPEAINLAAPGTPEGAVHDLLMDVLEVGPVLIIVDTQARYTPGAEENSSKDMGAFVQTLDHIQRFLEAAILVIHHATRGTDHARGSTSVEGAMQTELLIRKKRDTAELSTIKQKDGDELKMTLAPVAVGNSIVLEAPGIGADPFTLPVPPRVNEGSPVHERLAAVLYRTYDHGTTGGTRADIKAALQGDELRIEGDSRKVSRRFSQAWSKLEQLKAIEQVEGLQRYKLAAAYATSLELDRDEMAL